MKLPFFATLALLALAGAAIAQPVASDFEGTTSQQAAQERVAEAREQATRDMLRSVQKTSSQMRLACAKDRERLCADAKTSFRADRCLEGHRNEVAAPCRAALTGAAMAWNTPR